MECIFSGFSLSVMTQTSNLLEKELKNNSTKCDTTIAEAAVNYSLILLFLFCIISHCLGNQPMGSLSAHMAGADFSIMEKVGD